MPNQHDFIIDNDTAANARDDINQALQALASLSNGPTEPTTKYAYQLWYDTTNNQLKMYDGSSDWLVVGNVDFSGDTFTPSGGIPTGAVMAFAMNSAPSGWLECNGDAVSRTTYSSLFTAISTTYGVGDNSSTFNVPDLRAEFIRGWDDGRGVDSNRTFGSAQLDEFKAHSHTMSFGTSGWDAYTGLNQSGSFTKSTSTVGGSETRPRNVAMLYCIKY